MFILRRLVKQHSGTKEFWRNVWMGIRRSNSAPKKDLENEAYGEHPEMVFDLWFGDLKDEEGGAPVLVFFHGGGFIRGRRFYSKQMRLAHQQGVTVIAAGYRLSSDKEVSIEDSITDAEHLLAYLQRCAQKYKIDPARMAVCGNSAGGVLALSLALKKASISDLGMMYDVVCGYGYNTPTLLDPERFKVIMGLVSIQEFWYLWSKLFSVKKVDELNSKKVKGIIKRTSPELFIRQDAPPLFVEYSRTPPEDGVHTYKEKLVDILHSARFGEEFKRQADSMGMECILSHPLKKSEVDAIDFLLNHLKVEKQK